MRGTVARMGDSPNCFDMMVATLTDPSALGNMGNNG